MDFWTVLIIFFSGVFAHMFALRIFRVWSKKLSLIVAACLLHGCVADDFLQKIEDMQRPARMHIIGVHLWTRQVSIMPAIPIIRINLALSSMDMNWIDGID